MHPLIVVVLALLLGSCSSIIDRHVEWEYVGPDKYPTLEAVGYASISAQPGGNGEARVLNAIKVSKLEAYRELAEQLNGQQIDGQQTVGELALRDDRLRAEVSGLVRGAKVVRSYAVGDTYVTEMALDTSDMQRLYLITAPVRRIKDVTYY
ncbi:MAG: LPP20 family lipoprotein [Gammaproteobacteria bacterium]|nr:LPP20 family lipoprotein [Gammaproteobacteria bacterium]